MTGTSVNELIGYGPFGITRTWRVTYKGHQLGNAYSEEEGHRWIEDMRKMEEAGEYDPASAERERMRQLHDRA